MTTSDQTRPDSSETTAGANILPWRALIAWIVLVALSVANPLLGWELGHGTVVAIIVLALAAVKVRLVCLDFMELRHAPLGFRIAVEIYVVVLWSVLTGCLLWL